MAVEDVRGTGFTEAERSQRGTSPAASVIIPTHNRAAYLDLTLCSYLACPAKSSFEIIVVDDGGSDDTLAVVERYASDLQIQLVRRDQGGRAAARNTGIAAARGEVLIFADDDRIVAPQFVEAHLSAARQGDGTGRHRLTPVVLGKQHAILSFISKDILRSVPGALDVMARQQRGWNLPGTGSVQGFERSQIRTDFTLLIQRLAFPEPFWVNYVTPVILRYGVLLKGFQIPWALGTTGNLSASRQLVLDVGGFDEGFKGWGLEDCDLHYRLHRAGARTVVCLEAENYHQCHDRSGGLWESWFANASYLLDKHDTADVAAYVCRAFSREAATNLSELNEVLAELGSEALGASLKREFERLMRAHARTRLRATALTA